MLLGAPSQVTFQSCARRMSATASPGMMCPPVPPAMMRIERLIRLLRTKPHSSTKYTKSTKARLLGFCSCLFVYFVDRIDFSYSYRQTSRYPTVFIINSQQHCGGDAVHHQAAAAEAEERQGQPLGRQHAHVHADVDHRLHAEPHADALRGQRGKIAFEEGGMTADLESAHHQQRKQHDH